MRPLEDRAAIVTGASKGIGRALAVGLAENGARLIVNYKNDRQGAQATCEEIRALGGSAVAVRADVGDEADVQRVIRAALEEYGRLDVLVNNAGRTRFAPALSATPADWDDVMRTNVRGPFFGSLAAAPLMRDGGSIINVSSCAATLMLSHHGAYTTSKGALEAMTRQFAFELAPLGVRVNALAPGPTDIERNREYEPDFVSKWKKCIPMGRVPTPAAYVGAVVFLASDASEFMTGQVLNVDGGWTIQGRFPDMDGFKFGSDFTRG